MFGAIVLRDVPKEEARIDLVRYPIRGGFRGFQRVPAGLHYVSVKDRDHHVGFWCWLEAGDARVQVFDPQGGFRQDTPDSAVHYERLALSGAMAHALVIYDHTQFASWFDLVQHIRAEGFPPMVYADDEGRGFQPRFDRAFLGSHGGEPDSFLAEFQFAFLRWLVSLDAAAEDGAAFARWRHLLLACYNAGEDRIRASAALFAPLVDAMVAQFKLLPDEWFAGGSFLVQQAGYLIEDMEDTGLEELSEAARRFGDYMRTRQG